MKSNIITDVLSSKKNLSLLEVKLCDTIIFKNNLSKLFFKSIKWYYKNERSWEMLFKKW